MITYNCRENPAEMIELEEAYRKSIRGIREYTTRFPRNLFEEQDLLIEMLANISLLGVELLFHSRNVRNNYVNSLQTEGKRMFERTEQRGGD